MLQLIDITSVTSKWGKCWTFVSLVILFSVLPSNFVVSSIKSSRCSAVLTFYM